MEIFMKLPKPQRGITMFDAMCKRVEKSDLIKLPNDFYSKLSYLRRLRNRIHLHVTEGRADTDYLKFARKDFELMREILKALLTSHLFLDKSRRVSLGFLDGIKCWPPHKDFLSDDKLPGL